MKQNKKTMLRVLFAAALILLLAAAGVGAVSAAAQTYDGTDFDGLDTTIAAMTSGDTLNMSAYGYTFTKNADGSLYVNSADKKGRLVYLKINTPGSTTSDTLFDVYIGSEKKAQNANLQTIFLKSKNRLDDPGDWLTGDDIILLPKGNIYRQFQRSSPIDTYGNITLVGAKEGDSIVTCIYPYHTASSGNLDRVFRLYNRYTQNIADGKIYTYTFKNLIFDGVNNQYSANLFVVTSYNIKINAENVTFRNFPNAVFTVWCHETVDKALPSGSLYPSKSDNVGVEINLKNVTTENNGRLIHFDCAPYTSDIEAGSDCYAFIHLTYDNTCKLGDNTAGNYVYKEDGLSDATYDFNTSTAFGQNNCQINGHDVSLAAMEAKIGDKYYTKLDDAIAAAEDGDTVELLKDISRSAQVNIHIDSGKNVTIDGSNKTLTAGDPAAADKTVNGAAVRIDGPGNLYLKNITIKGPYKAAQPAWISGMGGRIAVKVYGGGENTFENVNIQNGAEAIQVNKNPGESGTKLTIKGENNHFEGNCYNGIEICDGCALTLASGVKVTIIPSTADTNKEHAYIWCDTIGGATVTGEAAVKTKHPVNPTTQDYWVIGGDAAAKIGKTTYADILDAIAAVTTGQTIELLKDIELSAPVRLDKTGTFTIDGKGHKLSAAAASNFGADGCLCFGPGGGGAAADIPTKIYTLKNVEFSGFTTGINDVIRAEYCTLTIDNCKFKDNTVAGTARSKAVVLTTGTNVTIKNSVFENNTCALCVDFNTQTNTEAERTGSTIAVDNCLFKQNPIGGNGVIYIYGPAGTIKDSTFEKNTISANGTGVIYFSGKLDSLTGCLFKENSVTETGAGKCGVLSFGSGAAGTAVTGNAFDGNTLTKASGEKATAYVGADNINLSSNYWDDGTAPEIGDGKDIFIVSGKTGTISKPYATAYTPNTGKYGVTVTTGHKYNVTANPSAGGTVTSSGTADAGDTINLTATANTGYAFVQWESSDVTITDPTSLSASFTMPAKDVTITAVFTHISDATASAADYVYGTTPSTPVLTPSISGAVFYHSTSAAGEGSPWDDGEVLNAGPYYVYAAASDGSQSKRTTFAVTQAPQAAPEFSVDVTGADVDVTIDNYDVNKKYEYELIIPGENTGNDTWIDVKENPFTIRGLKASTDYVINLRVKASADGNYMASDAASEQFTTSSIFSVVYNANGGLGKVPEAQESMTRVTVESPSNLYRLGYTFSGWNTQPDGTGTSYQPGTSISEGAVLYAQWTGNTYTVTFDANGGTGTMNPQEFTYGDVQRLSENKFVKDNWTFNGWAVKENGSAIYGDMQEVQDLTTESEITLYAVWVEHAYTINVTVTGADPGHTVKLTLKRGAAVIAEDSALNTSFANVPAGIYTLVADEIDSDGTIIKTITKRVDVKEDTSVTITFPPANVNSIVEVSPATVPVIADGITEEAVAKEGLGEKVTVTLNVDPAIEKELADTASEEEKEVQEAIALVKDNTEEDKTLEFISFTIKMDVDGTKDRLRETSNVIQLLIPFDFGAIKEGETVEVSYVHNGNYIQMTEVDTPDKPWIAGTYYLDRENNMIYINTDQFSVYAVSYKASSYSVTIQNPVAGGTASANPATGVEEGETVTLTAAPDTGYKLSKWNVISPEGLTITNNTFKMPASNVVIAPVWEKESSKRGSGTQGSSYWVTKETLTPTPTATPTPVPTQGTPTVKPIGEQTQTAKSPVPFAGILAGLGAAAAIFGLRRK